MAVNGGVVPLAGSLLGRKSVPNAQGAKCQRCLQVGHWTYECKNKRKYVHRSSRTSMLNKRLNQAQNEAQGILSINKTATEGKKKKKKTSSATESSSSSSDSDSDSSDSSDVSSDSSNSSSSDSSSSSSSEDSDSSSDESSDSSSTSSSDSSTLKKAKKKSKEKSKEKRNSDKTKNHQDEAKETKHDFHNELKKPILRSFLKPKDSDDESVRRKTNKDYWPNTQHKSKKHVETQNPITQHIKKRGHDTHRGERHDDAHGYFEEHDRPSKHLNNINDSRDRYERRKNSSVYWSKAGEEEEKKLQAENESAKQHEKKSERKRKEHDDHHSSKESRRQSEPDPSNDNREKKKDNYDQWSSEQQEESNHSEEEMNSKRFYENVEHGRRRHKEHDSYYIQLEEPTDQSRTESSRDDPENKIGGSYWSYEMERMRKQTGDQNEPERSPEHSKKSGHKKKRHEVDEYLNEVNGSKKLKTGSTVVHVYDSRDEKEKSKTESSRNKSPEKHKSRKDEKKHHAKTKIYDEKKRKSDKHAGHASPVGEKPIDYDDFDVQGRNDFEPAVSPTYNFEDSAGERRAKSHSKKSKHKEKKNNREFSLESSDGASSDIRRGERAPSPKRMKELNCRSPERKREDKKSRHNKHR